MSVRNLRAEIEGETAGVTALAKLPAIAGIESLKIEAVCVADPGWTQALEKFNSLLRPRLADSARNEIVERVSRLETERDLRGLVALTRLSP